jgi:ATP-binding cassette subfamily B protein
MTNKSKKINLQDFRYKPRGFLFFVARKKMLPGIFLGLAVIFGRIIITELSFVVKKLTDLLSNFSGNIKDIYFYALLLVIFMFLSTAFFRISGFIGSRWMPRLEKFAAQVSFDYLIYHSSQYFANRLSGKLQNKVFNISNAVGSIFPIIFWNFLDLFVKLLVSIILAFTVNLIIGLIFVFFISISIVYSALVAKKLSLYSKEKTLAASESRGGMVDTLVNILAVKQNVASEREIEYNGSLLNEYKKKHIKRRLNRIKSDQNLSMITQLA